MSAEIWTIAQTVLGPAVLLRPVDSDRVIPIYIGLLETQSILLGLAGKEAERPLTHDLMKRLIDELGVEISHIVVTRIQDNTYFAELHGSLAEREFAIDARPSDCMALAVRMGCPIYVEEAVLDEAGVAIADLNISNTEQQSDLQISELEKKLEEAVEQENYEEAAHLRDMIRDLKKKES